MSIQDIKNTYRIEEVIGRSVSLKKQATEMVGNCPFHDDHTASMKVNPVKQYFKCFACGAGGDVVDFFTMQGYDFATAKNFITNGGIIAVNQPTEKTPDIIWKDAVPNQEQLPDVSKLSFKDYGNPSMFWAYTNRNGKTCGYVLRFDLPDGKKDVIPYTFKKRITNGSESNGWYWKGFEIKRPLYNLHEILSRPTAIILVVEGEKTAEAAKKLFPKYVCTTWIGGGENIKNADLSPLENRKVYLWADNDTAGIHCMFGGWSRNEKTGNYRRIMGVTDLVSAEFKRIHNSKDFPKKWDVADADWTPEEAEAYLKANRMDIPSVSEHAPNELPEPAKIQVLEPEKITEIVPSKPKLAERDDTPKNTYFNHLGFENNGDQNLFVFFVYRTNVIVKLSAGGISGSNILQLAPLNYWEGEFPKQSKSGPVKYEITTIADHLITACSKIGIFKPSKIRGRGAWMDEGRSVLHCGDTLIVDGNYMEFGKLNSRYIYEASQELGFNLVNPANNTDANKLIQILERLNWGRGVNARLLAGWVVIAPFCGALKWRPHLWLTGSSGAGKSEIMKIIKTFMGDFFVDAQSETTEAGIRQFLKADALPVIFDEAESEDRKAQERMQSVLNIMRASSTSDSGKIIKGSSHGTAAQFNIRSCFAFASIGANLTQRSDISRITVLEIKPDTSADKKQHWIETQKLFSEIDSQEYIDSFQSRALKLLPVILHNAKIFSSAAAAELDNQRAGDQLGALLAGAYSLTSNKEISFENASKWIRERDWSEERLMDSTRDEVKLINYIMDSELEVEGMYGKRRMTIGELVKIASGDIRPDPMDYGMPSTENIKSSLNRSGLKISARNLVISDSSQSLKKILSNTPYSKNYHTILSRVNGAEKIDSTVFASHIQVRATQIPLDYIFGKSDSEEVLRVFEEQKRIQEIENELFNK